MKAWRTQKYNEAVPAAIKALSMNVGVPVPVPGEGDARGTCSVDSGKPEDIEANEPDSYVQFANIAFGTIGSTFSGGSPNPEFPNNPGNPRRQPNNTLEARYPSTNMNKVHPKKGAAVLARRAF